MVQRVFIGDANRAVDLMRDQRALMGGLRGADLGAGDSKGCVLRALDRACCR